jgi:septal ring factor EnvC (AmiA/AmiB activator)
VSAVVFDTLKFAERLEAGGFSAAQAKAAAFAFADASAEQLITRQGLREDIEPMASGLAAITADMKMLKSDVATLRTDVTALKADLRQVELRLSGEMTLLKWMLGLVVAGILALVLKAYFPH